MPKPTRFENYIYMIRLAIVDMVFGNGEIIPDSPEGLELGSETNRIFDEVIVPAGGNWTEKQDKAIKKVEKLISDKNKMIKFAEEVGAKNLAKIFKENKSINEKLIERTKEMWKESSEEEKKEMWEELPEKKRKKVWEDLTDKELDEEIDEVMKEIKEKGMENKNQTLRVLLKKFNLLNKEYGKLHKSIFFFSFKKKDLDYSNLEHQARQLYTKMVDFRDLFLKVCSECSIQHQFRESIENVLQAEMIAVSALSDYILGKVTSCSKSDDNNNFNKYFACYRGYVKEAKKHDKKGREFENSLEN